MTATIASKRQGRASALFAAVLFSAFLSLTPVALAASMDDALDALFRRYLDERFALHPVQATELGDHRFDDRMDDLSPAGIERSLNQLKQARKSLRKAVDRSKLSRNGQIDYDIFDHDLETSIWLAENTHPYAENPRLYNQYISDSVFLLLTQSRLPAETNLANALARMRHIPEVIAAARQNLRHPPRAVLETAIRQNRGSIQFYEGEISKFISQGLQAGPLLSAAQRVVPTLRDYQQFLEKELLPRATGDWRLGKRKFAAKFSLTLDAGISADELLRDAEVEYSRVHGEMYIVARQLWSRYMTNQALPPADPAGRHETVARVLRAVAGEHGQPDELVGDARRTVGRIKDFIGKNDILRLPEPDHCQIIEMPEFQRGNSVAYLNGAPALDPDAPSFYAISPPARDWPAQQVRSLLEEYNRHMLQILTIHEAYPGHYVQLEYSSRSPSLIRRVLGSGVMVEGWAVYTEQMMLDQGYGDGDLALRPCPHRDSAPIPV